MKNRLKMDFFRENSLKKKEFFVKVCQKLDFLNFNRFFFSKTSLFSIERICHHHHSLLSPSINFEYRNIILPIDLHTRRCSQSTSLRMILHNQIGTRIKETKFTNIQLSDIDEFGGKRWSIPRLHDNRSDLNPFGKAGLLVAFFEDISDFWFWKFAFSLHCYLRFLELFAVVWWYLELEIFVFFR